MAKMFSPSQLQAIADALGDTVDGLTGSEIAHLLRICRMNDTTPDMTKRHRLFNAFVDTQNRKQDRVPVLGFILIDRALGGELPLLTINAFTSENDKSEQKGFVNLVKGVFGMFNRTCAEDCLGAKQRGRGGSVHVIVSYP
jgi:hypothetical protein